jgi:hypothetical protein
MLLPFAWKSKQYKVNRYFENLRSAKLLLNENPLSRRLHLEIINYKYEVGFQQINPCFMMTLLADVMKDVDNIRKHPEF